jgi:DNA invertase Pin-like site-specific DNA recombinase
LSLFIYARKSTDTEDKQVLSIEAQLAELRTLAKREGFHVTEELVEKQSAKKPGRPIFNDMLTRLENGEAQGILSWHPDRLARNSLDGGRVIYMLDIGTIAALKFNTFWFEPTPQGKFMLGLAFGQSKYYIDSLSENIQRGMRAKIRQKRYPGYAPFGYINDYRLKKPILDPERSPIVKEAFERYASGKDTLDSLRRFFAERGHRSSGGKIVGASYIARIITNPFYYGHFTWADEIYEGDHEPIVTKALFDQVQAVVKNRQKQPHRKEHAPSKPFMQLMRCSECGCMITAEVQKGHTYYHCTGKNSSRPRCTQPWVRGEVIDAEISRLLAGNGLTAGQAEELLVRLETDEKSIATITGPVLVAKKSELEKTEAQLGRLRDALIDGLIERTDFLRRKSDLFSTKKSLEEQLVELTYNAGVWVGPFRMWILEAMAFQSSSTSVCVTDNDS